MSTDRRTDSVPVTPERLAELVRHLTEAEAELQACLADQVDAIVGHDGHPLLLEKAQHRLIEQEAVQRQAAELQTAILDALPANIALLGSDGTILAVNESWRQFGRTNAATGSDFFVGRNYLAICDSAAGECGEEARATAEGIRAVLSGSRTEFSLEYPCHSPTEKRWYRLVVSPLRPGRLTGVVVMHLNVTERKLAEFALAESESQQRGLAVLVERERARLAAAQAVAKVGSWETDLSTFTVTWSEETHHIFGTDPATFAPTHQAFLARVHPDDRAAVESAFTGSVQSDGVHQIEHRVISIDGTVKVVEERWQVFRDAEGRPVRALGTCHDITERAQAQAELQRAQTMARIAGRLARLGAWSVDLQTMTCHFSEEVCAIHELPPESSISLEDALAFYPPEMRPRIEARFTECARQGTPYDIEVELITARGRRLTARAIGEAVRDARGQIVGVQGALQDISEQKRAEREKRALAERLATTLESITDGFFTLDGEGRFTFVNHQAEVMLNQSRLELLGRKIGDAFPEAKDTVFAEHYRAAWGEMRPVQFEGYFPPLARWFEVRVFPHPEGLAVYFRDVTEDHRAREDLARTNRALQLLSRCNEALVRTENEQTLLDTVCQLAIDVGGYRMVWVGYAQNDEAKSIDVRAAAGAETDYFSGLQLSWSDDIPTGRGPAGRTIRSGQSMVVENVAESEYFRPWRSRALAAGFHGVVCLPLNDGPRTFGLMGLYLGEVRTLPPHEFKMLQEMADNLAYGIVACRARLERKRTHDAVLAMARGLSGDIGIEFFHQLVQSLVEALGADAACLAVLPSPDAPSLQPLAAVSGGARMSGFAFALAALPASRDQRTEVAVIDRGLDAMWPEARHLLPGGSEGFVGSLLYDTDGQIVGALFAQFRGPLGEPEFAVSTLRIYAARAAAELERERSAARTREQAALLDKAQDAILVRDLTHRITYWNKSAERLYGWKAEEARGRSVRDLLYFEPSEFDRAMSSLMDQGEWVGELTQVRKDGQPLTIEGRWTLVRNDVGEPVSILAINTDITDRKKLEAQFLRAQRMESIGTLAGGIAHDLNNLLAPITMGVDLLKRSDPRPEHQRLLATIERSAQRGADLVKQVLSFARGVEGARVELQLRHIVHELEVIVHNTFPKNVRFETKVESNLWPVLGDPTQLNQVLLNLLVNARDAMPTGGQATLSVYNTEVDAQYAVMNRGVAPGSYVVLEVGDTGVGMEPPVIERIFEPFYTTKEVGKGTGLGLSTVLGIVRSHGGFVNVYSEPGRGSTFKVYLPARPEAPPAAGAAPPTPAALPAGRGETILVVDDEPTILEVTRETLQSHGYAVLTAEDGAQAIGTYAVNRTRIATVITDMMMPVMDGHALITALRRINPEVRIIAASGLAANGGLSRGAAPDVRHFLAKPYSAEAMLTLLRTVLDEPSGSRPPMVSGPP